MDREERKREYLKSFIRTFAESGIDRTPVKKLAKAAKINEASIYQYFKNKDEIIVDCVGLYLEGEADRMLQILSDRREPFEARVRQVLKICYEPCDECQFVIQVLTSPAYSELCSPLLRAFNERFLSTCVRNEGMGRSEEPPMAPALPLLIMSAVIGYKVLGDRELLRLQIEYLLRPFRERKYLTEEDFDAVLRIG